MPINMSDVGFDPSIAPLRNISVDQMQKLKGFIRKRVMNPEDVDDILQCTFLEALRNESKFQQASQPSTWLCGIAINLIRNHFRRHYSQPQQEALDGKEDFNIDQQSDVDQQVDGQRQLERTIQAIEKLPTDMREIIWFSVQSDGGYQETADVLGVPIGTIRSRLSRAREKLRKAMPYSA